MAKILSHPRVLMMFRAFFLVLFLMLFLATFGPVQASAFSTPDYSLAAPSGWTEHVKMFGMDVLYMGRVTGERPQPVFGVMTQEEALSSGELAKFLGSSVKKDLAGRGISNVRIVAKGKARQVQADAYYMTYDYSAAKGPMRDLAVLVRGKGRYHLLLFTVARADYDFYYKDVAPSIKSFKLAR